MLPSGGGASKNLFCAIRGLKSAPLPPTNMFSYAPVQFTRNISFSLGKMNQLRPFLWFYIFFSWFSFFFKYCFRFFSLSSLNNWLEIRRIFLNFRFLESWNIIEKSKYESQSKEFDMQWIYVLMKEYLEMSSSGEWLESWILQMVEV